MCFMANDFFRLSKPQRIEHLVFGMADLLAFRAGTASSGGKRPDLIDQREPVVLSYKNIQVWMLSVLLQ
jgi:hypothetical protein